MEKYILTNTDKFLKKIASICNIDPNSLSSKYYENYKTFNDAKSRMNKWYYYYINANMNVTITKAKLNERSAMIELSNGDVIEWEIIKL